MNTTGHHQQMLTHAFVSRAQVYKMAAPVSFIRKRLLTFDIQYGSNRSQHRELCSTVPGTIAWYSKGRGFNVYPQSLHPVIASKLT
jgi:hypothetical protein